MKAFAGKERLRVLFLSQRFLYPMDTGGKIRTGKLLEKLRDIFDITLISNVESPKDDCYLGEMKKLCTEFRPVPWKEINKYTVKFYLRLLWRTFSRYPITVINDYSKALENKVLNAIEEKSYDLLVCDFLQPSLNFKKITGYPMLLFQHNVETVLIRRYFEVARNHFSKLFWLLQWLKMVRYERITCRRFKAVVTVSEIDKKILEAEFSVSNVYTIPTGIDTEYFSPCNNRVKANSLVFAGSMDWLPNEDAILFFAREILWRIKAHIPTITLTVVGRNPSCRLLTELKGYSEIEVVGWVDDVRPFISRHALYIIPLRIGSGTRIKVYEAMAMGKAVVSTSVGTEGLPISDGEQVVLADTPDEFAQAVIELLRNAEMRRRIEMAAREFVRKNCSWEKAAEVFAEICRKIVETPNICG